MSEFYTVPQLSDEQIRHELHNILHKSKADLVASMQSARAQAEASMAGSADPLDPADVIGASDAERKKLEILAAMDHAEQQVDAGYRQLFDFVDRQAAAVA